MLEKRVLVYSEGDFDLEGGSTAEQLREVFKGYEELKGDPFSEVYKGRKVTQTLKVISENFFNFILNKVRTDEGILGVSKRRIKEEKCDIVVFNNVEFEDTLSKYYESLEDIQSELVRNLNSVTEERNFLKNSFKKVDLGGE